MGVGGRIGFGQQTTSIEHKAVFNATLYYLADNGLTRGLCPARIVGPGDGERWSLL